MKLRKNILLAPLLTLCFLVGAQTVSALTISPVKIEVTGDPGQTLTGELELLNEQAQTKTFFSSYENFEPSGDTGSPRFIGAEGGLATWFSASPSVTVNTGETVKVPFSITIPADAEPGGYFAAIFWGEQDPTTQLAGEVAIGGKLGVLVLLRVSGDIVEQAGISEFKHVDNKMFISGLPVTFTYRFANSGGDRVVPIGEVTISNIFGGETGVISANPNEGSVLPNSSRRFQAVWGDDTSTTSLGFFGEAKAQFSDFHLGPYKANLSVVYGATNQLAESSFWFIIFPWQLLVLILLALIIAVVLLKQYNSWIISKSKTKG
jgi:hypothetical protein